MGIKRYNCNTMNIKFSNTLIKAVLIICLVVIIDVLGIAFLVLKTVSLPFVPNRNIDAMSDYYTAVWKSVRGAVDNGRFVIIDITENSRREITEILNTVNNMNPAIIGLDVSYIHEEDPNEDSLLVQTIQSLTRLVLPVEYLDNEQGSESFHFGIFHNQLINKEYGVVSFPENRDILRTYNPSFKIGNQSIDAFGCVIAQKCGADISHIHEKSNLLINYTTLELADDDVAPGFQFLNLNVRDSLSLASEIAGKIVLIGSTNLTSDQHLTPLGNSLSGLMVHAHIINTLIENKSIRTTPLIIRYLFCFIMALVILLWFQKRKPSEEKNNKIWKQIIMWSILFCVSVLLFAVIGTFLFCNLCYYINFAPYIVTLILVYFIKDKKIDFIKLCKL